MEGYFNEDGLSFFDKSQKRLLKKTGIDIIDTEIKDIGFQNLVEIHSNDITSTLECFMKLLVNAILPEDYEDIKFGGSNLKVFYFDNNFKFVIWRFIQILESHIFECAKVKFKNLKDEEDLYNKVFKGKNNYEEFIRKCMSNIKLFQCVNAFQFYVTLESIIESNHNIPLILIDSLNTFFYLDKNYHDKSYQCLMKLSQMGIFIYISKYIIKKYNQEFSDYDDKNVLKLFLEDQKSKLEFKNYKSQLYSYNITNNGIKFNKL